MALRVGKVLGDPQAVPSVLKTACSLYGKPSQACRRSRFNFVDGVFVWSAETARGTLSHGEILHELGTGRKLSPGHFEAFRVQQLVSLMITTAAPGLSVNFQLVEPVRTPKGPRQRALCSVGIWPPVHWRIRSSSFIAVLGSPVGM
jgi:hypothetical protein